jgi:hypothetical protein
MSRMGTQPTVPNVTAEPRKGARRIEGEGKMKRHEGKMGGRLKQRARLVAAATALVSALALSAPAMAGAGTSGTSKSSSSITITQNTAMIVDVSTLDLNMSGTVSWSDVSWSDVY